MTWNLSKVILALGRLSVTPLMKAGDMSMLTEAMFSGSALWVRRCSAKPAMVSASRPSVTNTTLRASASAAKGQIVMATLVGGLVDRHRLDRRQLYAL